MSGIGEKLNDILVRLAEMLGLKKSDGVRFREMEHKLIQSRADNNDRLDALKDEIRVLEARAITKKKEFEQARGDSRKIVAGEIERTFRELDQLHNREKIIGANLDRIATSQAKLKELQDAKAQGVEEDHIDELALELQEVFSGLKVADRAARDLDRVAYEPVERHAVDLEQRLAETSGEREAQPELSNEIQKRLEELETEE